MCHILNRLLYLRIPADIFYLKYWFHNHWSNLIQTRSGSALYFSRDSDIASVGDRLDWHRKWLLKYYSYISMQCIGRYLWRSRSYLYAVLYDVSSSPASRQHSLLLHSSVFFRILLEFNLLFSLQIAESLVIYYSTSSMLRRRWVTHFITHSSITSNLDSVPCIDSYQPMCFWSVQIIVLGKLLCYLYMPIELLRYWLIILALSRLL